MKIICNYEILYIPEMAEEIIEHERKGQGSKVMRAKIDEIEGLIYLLGDNERVNGRIIYLTH